MGHCQPYGRLAALAFEAVRRAEARGGSGWRSFKATHCILLSRKPAGLRFLIESSHRYGGLQRIAGLDFGPPSAVATMLCLVQADEGQERCVVWGRGDWVMINRPPERRARYYAVEWRAACRLTLR